MVHLGEWLPFISDFFHGKGTERYVDKIVPVITKVKVPRARYLLARYGIILGKNTISRQKIYSRYQYLRISTLDSAGT